jgi:Family of unknown function (DUF5677)
MARKGRGKKKAKRRSSSLADHQRDKKTLIPPFLQLPKMVMTSWPHTGVPECIWLAAVSDEVRSRSGPHRPLDVLDEFVPEGKEVLDGRISQFVLVPEEERAKAREALRERAPEGLPVDLGHGLALYPDCPALWLYEDWLAENGPDADRGIAYLKRLVGPIIPPRDTPSSEVRLLVIARLAKNGKFHLRADMAVAELLPRYPMLLNAEDRAHVESFARNAWNIHTQIGKDPGTPKENPWSQYFWSRSFEISDCEPEPGDAPVLDETEEELPTEPEPEQSAASSAPAPPRVVELKVGDVRDAFVQAIDVLGAGLRALQETASLDTFSAETDEVKLGLASRAFRLLRRLALDPRLWTNEMAPHLIRSMVDERIVAAWLIKQDDPEMYAKFKEYGRGKRKLFKLKLEQLMDSDDLAAEDAAELHRTLEAEVNQDTMEEFLVIDLGGTFSGKNIREMAIETDLADLYSLSYQPLSSESHGEWGSLVQFDLRYCGNPLHLYHRLGRFDTGEEGSYPHIGWVRIALDLAESTIGEVFQSIGLDTDELFNACHDAMNRATAQTPPE